MNATVAVAAEGDSSPTSPLPTKDVARIVTASDIYVGNVLLESTDPHPIVVQISRFHQPADALPILGPTLEALEKAFGRGKLQVEVFRGGIVDPEKADLILTSSGAYRKYAYLGTRDLATVVSDDFPNPNRAEGSVFVVRADRTDLHTLADLQGKVVAATGQFSFSGYQIGLHELYAEKLPVENFFAEKHWEPEMVDVLGEVDDRKADVGIIRTCVLERLAEHGMDTSVFKVLHPKNEPGFPCQVSTELYPNWTFYATRRATPEVASLAARALLSMPSVQGNLHWEIATDFTRVDQLYFDLKEGQFEFRRHWSFKEFWVQYRDWFGLFALGLVGILLHLWRSEHLLKVRTRELLEVQSRLLAVNERLTKLQKVGIIGQMSSIIAHELRQPLSAVVSYIHGLERQLDGEGEVPPEKLSRAFERIRDQVTKVNTIVERVRSYAKSQQSAAQPEGRVTVDLKSLLKECERDLSQSMVTPIPLTLKAPAGLLVKVNPLEAKLVFLNLIKNAIQAQQGLEQAWVRVTATREESEEEGSAAETISITVQDNGPAVSDAQFARLLEPLSSSKMEGLGLGLTIVQLIVENHGGTLRVARGDPQGLIFTVRLPAASSETRSTSAPSHPSSVEKQS